MKIKFAPQVHATKKAGLKVLICQGQPEDAKELLAYAAQMSKQSKFVVSTPEDFLKMPVKKEQEWIASHRDHEDRLLLLVFEDLGTSKKKAVKKGSKKSRKVIGSLSFSCYRPARMKHVGVFGMSVAKSHHGLGIGELLMRAMLQWKDHRPNIKKIELEVVRENVAAVRLYEKMGFNTEGVRLKAFKSKASVHDLFWMAKHF